MDLIVPYGPGGGSDQMARLVAPIMEEELGIEIPVINIPGATGSVGTTQMVSRPPGSAMASTTAGVLTTVAFGTATFDPEKVRGVCRTQVMPSGLLVASDGPYDSWQELVDAAKESPGKLKVATVGRNSADTIILTALSREAGIEFQPVPFAEPGQRYGALLGGDVAALYEQPGDLLSQLQGNLMETVLIFGDEPVSGLQSTQSSKYVVSGDVGLDVPVLNQYRGILIHAETDDRRVEILSDACASIRGNPEWKKFQSRNFALPDSYMPAEQFDAYRDEYLTKLENVIQKYGLQTQSE